MDRTKPTLSVVVISWNQFAHIRRLVTELLDQDYETDRYEIIVVDDGSTDGTREWLRSVSNERIRPIFGDRHGGRAASRNRGIKVASGNIVVMIDGDHSVERDFLAIHASRHASERCVIVGKSEFEDHPDSRALNHYLNNGGAAKLSLGSRLPGRYFLTRNCSVPTDLLLEIGLFDERFNVWGGEDLDLGMRLEETATPIYGETRCLAVHHHLRPLHELLRNLLTYGKECLPLLLARHPRLFYELNLDRTFSLLNMRSRYSVFYRGAFRLLMYSPVCFVFRFLVVALRRHHLPRIVFDYLHLRQYTRGYMSYLATAKEKKRSGGTH
ncbi:glycosyltransferase [bacterium]|nr:glycosyltransferase [bacterium]MBU1985321.1 glycosyltransferase [bacterium]